MLTRADFAIPEDIAYLNAAAFGVLSRVASDAGRAAIDAQAAPWLIDKAALAADAERLRALAGKIVGADANDIAIVDSVSQAMAVAANGRTVPTDSRIVLMAGEHPSNALIWAEAARRAGASIEPVPAPADGDWTAAIVATLTRPDAPPTSIVAISAVHWGDGGHVDMRVVGDAVRATGAAFVVDATHAVGVMPIDLSATPADYVAFPLFKWLLGPYGLAMLYVAPARQEVEPLERHAQNCRLGPGLVFAGFADGARRFDRGERDDPMALAIAVAALEQVTTWDVCAVAASLCERAGRFAQVAERHGLTIAGRTRASHIVCAAPVDGTAAAVVAALGKDGVFVAERLGRLRISPHVYNDDTDLDRFELALSRALT